MDCLSCVQDIAVNADDKFLLIKAAPGAGKTTVITERAFHFIKSKKHRPENVVVTTFTKKAANEVLNRIRCLTPTSMPFVGTFHALAHRILQQNYPHPNYTIADEILR